MRRVGAVLKAALFAALAAAGGAYAQQTTYDTASQAASWLNLPNSARTSAMGGASVALSGDVNTVTVNPAGLSGLMDQQLSLMDNVYVQGLSFEHVAYGVGLDGSDGAALSLDYMDYGSVPENALSDGVLVQAGSLNPYGLGTDLGYGHAFGSLSVGATLKLVTENLGVGGANSTLGGDLGLLWDAQHGLSAGLAVENLGGTLDGANLATQVRCGLAYAVPLQEGRQNLCVAGDAEFPTADSNAEMLSLGAEYSGDSLWVLRAGYKYIGEGGVGGLSVGGGLRFGILSLDYAFMSEGVLGAANLVSLSAHFAGPVQARKAALAARGASARASAPGSAGPKAVPDLGLSLEQGVFSPALGIGQGRVRTFLRAGDRCQAWALFIYEGKSPARVIQARGSLPQSIAWDGTRNDGSRVPAGVYPLRLAVRLADGKLRYSDGYVAFSVYDSFPALSLQWDARSLDPQKTGGFRLVPSIFRVLTSAADPGLGWRLRILGPDGKLFRTFSGALNDASNRVWDGTSDRNQEFYSNYVYEFRLELVDRLGNLLKVADDQRMTMVFSR